MDNRPPETVNINLNVTINVGGPTLTCLTRIGDALMALSQDLKDLTKKIDDATTAVAARIDALTAKITNSMTDAEVADVKAGLQAESDRLTALGADPNNPVPTP